MARWDEILTLPVQHPAKLEFSSADLMWSNVDGHKQVIDRVALIPFSRIHDFVKGESGNAECPTRFHVEARRRRRYNNNDSKTNNNKKRVDGLLEYILYWCSFGPDDHRQGGASRPSRPVMTNKKKSVGRPNSKRGCSCHFIVKRLAAEPSVALIIYNQHKHVDKKGLPCHGPLDLKAAGTRASYAPEISDELRLRVVSLIHAGVTVESIMHRHNEMVEKRGGPSSRDDMLTQRHVRRLERSIRRSMYKLDEDDLASTATWVENHQHEVFFYQELSDTEPFLLGIQTEWQLQQMMKFGNRSLMASDSRFGTNKLKYSVHSLLVFSENKTPIPVAWILTVRFASYDSYRWIRALYNRIHEKDQTWKLAGFIVDDPTMDIPTIREVFSCSILVSFWRVRHAWHKNLLKKCADVGTCSEVFNRLGDMVYSICCKCGDEHIFQEFLEDSVDNTEFIEYFAANWLPKIGKWVTALQTFSFASKETSTAIENYHHRLKLRLFNEKDTDVYQRVDWLANKLATKVHSYFWLDEYVGKDDYVRYAKDEWVSGLTSWHRALSIPDSDVYLGERFAKVISQRNREVIHLVHNPGSEYALCECEWSRLGNLCKHVIKANKVHHHSQKSATPSISLVHYNQMLMTTLECPPHESLILDYALSFAVQLQKQLNGMVDFSQRRSSSTMHVDQHIAGCDPLASAPKETDQGDTRDEEHC